MGVIEVDPQQLLEDGIRKQAATPPETPEMPSQTPFKPLY